MEQRLKCPSCGATLPKNILVVPNALEKIHALTNKLDEAEQIIIALTEDKENE